MSILSIFLVPRPVSIDICMDYLVNGTTKLNISWNVSITISIYTLIIH